MTFMIHKKVSPGPGPVGLGITYSASVRAAISSATLLVIALSLSGCGFSVKDRMLDSYAYAESSITRLGAELDKGSLRNAALIKRYSNKIRESKPDLSGIARVLEKEATRQGTLYTSLQTRLKDVRSILGRSESEIEQQSSQLASELANLLDASDTVEFDRALADPLNVLADLSGGILPRVDSISATASKVANGAADFGPGSQLVGNPNYGEWRTGSGGSSFWAWYGQYALFRGLLGGPRIGYGNWAAGRDYSYYHDYGRGHYTSPQASQRQSQVASTARRKFSSAGRTFRSPYAKTRMGASTSVTRAKFVSTSKPSSFGSFRGLGSGGYRGPSRGK